MSKPGVTGRDRGDQGDACKAGLSRAERSGPGDWGQRLHCPAAQPGRAGPVTEYYLIAPDKRNTEAAYIKLQKSTKHTPRNSSKHTILQFYVQARTNSQQAKGMSATQPAKTAARSNPPSLLAELSPALCPRELAARPPGISGPSSRDDGIPA